LDGRVRARPDSDLVAAIVAHNGLTTAPLSATGETACIVPAHAVARANISRASFLPAAIPHRVIGVEERHERLPIIPIIKHPVVPAPFRIDTIWEPDEGPAFDMGWSIIRAERISAHVN